MLCQHRVVQTQWCYDISPYFIRPVQRACRLLPYAHNHTLARPLIYRVYICRHMLYTYIYLYAYTILGWVLTELDVCRCGCAYTCTVRQRAQRPGVCSADYATVHYKKTSIRVLHIPDIWLPFVSILAQMGKKQRKYIFTNSPPWTMHATEPYFDHS